MRGRALALAAVGALALPAAAAAQEPAAPAGTFASVEVLTGGDYTLEIWRDAATGRIALIDTRSDAGEQVTWVRGTSLVPVEADPNEVFELRYRGREELSGAIRALNGIDLDGVEAALAAGTPAAAPAEVTASLAVEATVPAEDVDVSEHFGSAVRALARRSAAPVAWAGPRRLGKRVRQTSLVRVEDDRGRGSRVASVTYGRGPIAFPGLCDACFGVTSAPAGSPAARAFTGGRPFTERIGGRPAVDSPFSGSIAVRLGPLVVLVDDELSPRALRRLVRSLRIIRA